jgi:uncharacterized delta-60 repeat protein
VNRSAQHNRIGLLVCLAVALVSFSLVTVAGAAVPGTFLADPTDDVPGAVAFQADGKILAGGTSRCLGRFCEYGALERFGTDGKLDPSFGTEGRVGGEAAALSEIRALAVQPDGKILAGGVVAASGAPGEARGGEFAVARFLPDGTLDASFGEAGVATTTVCLEPSAGAVNDLAIQPDGRIVAAGFVSCGKNRAAVIARFLPDGSADPAFREGWLALDADPKLHETLRAVALRSDGRIVVGGGSDGALLVFELTPSGHLNDSWGNAGAVETLFTDRVRGKRRKVPVVVNDLLVDTEGRVVAAAGRGGKQPTGTLVRYLAGGKIDPRFGGHGFSATPGLDPLGMARDRCGRTILAGAAYERSVESFATAFLRADGTKRKGWLEVERKIPRPSRAAAIATAAGHAAIAGSSQTLSGFRHFAVVDLRLRGC